MLACQLVVPKVIQSALFRLNSGLIESLSIWLTPIHLLLQEEQVDILSQSTRLKLLEQFGSSIDLVSPEHVEYGHFEVFQTSRCLCLKVSQANRSADVVFGLADEIEEADHDVDGYHASEADADHASPDCVVVLASSFEVELDLVPVQVEAPDNVLDGMLLSLVVFYHLGL